MPPAQPDVKLSLWNRIILIYVYCFAVGYADVICLLQYSTYAAMQTGNLISMVMSIFYPKIDESKLGVPEPVWRSLIILAFLVGVMMHRVLKRFTHRSRWSSPVWFALTIVVTMCGLNGAGLYRRRVPASWDCVGLAMVFGMQTAASTLGGLNSATTLVTMHIRDLGCFLVKLCSCEAKRQDYLNALISFGAPFSLALGVLVGSCATKYSKHVFEPEILLLFVAPVLLVLMIAQDCLVSRQIRMQEMELAGRLV